MNAQLQYHHSFPFGEQAAGTPSTGTFVGNVGNGLRPEEASAPMEYLGANWKIDRERQPNEEAFYITFLKRELAHKKSKNSRYSLRAFAQSLQLDASALSRILLGKQLISLRTAEKVASLLKVSKEEKRLFLASVVREKNLVTERRLAQKIDVPDLGPDVRHIDLENFVDGDAMTDLCVLEATSLNGFESTYEWIAARLKISVEQAQRSIDKLLRLGLLQAENGKWKKSTPHLHTGFTDRITEKHRQTQKAVIERALEAMDDDPMSLTRVMANMVMAIDTRKLPAARKMIQRFIEDFCDFMENGERGEIYNVAVQFFPFKPQSNSPQV